MELLVRPSEKGVERIKLDAKTLPFLFRRESANTFRNHPLVRNEPAGHDFQLLLADPSPDFVFERDCTAREFRISNRFKNFILIPTDFMPRSLRDPAASRTALMTSCPVRVYFRGILRSARFSPSADEQMGRACIELHPAIRFSYFFHRFPFSPSIPPSFVNSRTFDFTWHLGQSWIRMGQAGRRCWLRVFRVVLLYFVACTV